MVTTPTDTQVAQLAGRELDTLVAERVMGLCVHIPERVPPDVIAASRREDFKAEYGQEPPESWDGDAYSEYEWDHDHWPWRCKKCGERCNARAHLADYSTDIQAAWEVVEHRFKLVNIRQIRVAGLPDIWSVIINDGVAVENESAPLAICLAALRELDRRGNH